MCFVSVLEKLPLCWDIDILKKQLGLGYKSHQGNGLASATPSHRKASSKFCFLHFLSSIGQLITWVIN